MSTNDPTQQVPPADAPPAPGAPAIDTSPAIDPREYELMQQQLRDAQATFEVLNPHAARIKRLVDDPEAAAMFDRTLSAYEEMQKQRGPQIDDNVKPIYEKVSKLESFVDRYEKQQKDEAERPQREFVQHYTEWQNSPVNNRFFTRVMADHPELKPRDWQYLAQIAAENNFEPLEATWKREGWRFVRSDSSAPPTSLRADAGEVGTSAPGTQPPPGGPTMRDRIIQLERQRRGISA